VHKSMYNNPQHAQQPWGIKIQLSLKPGPQNIFVNESSWLTWLKNCCYSFLSQSHTCSIVLYIVHVLSCLRMIFVCKMSKSLTQFFAKCTGLIQFKETILDIHVHCKSWLERSFNENSRLFTKVPFKETDGRTPQ
jgi:hypothetical protein